MGIEKKKRAVFKIMFKSARFTTKKEEENFIISLNLTYLRTNPEIY